MIWKLLSIEKWYVIILNSILISIYPHVSCPRIFTQVVCNLSLSKQYAVAFIYFAGMMRAQAIHISDLKKNVRKYNLPI